jgi:CRP-like cAMP-binding protein
MQTIDQYLPESPFFQGLDGSIIDLLAGCAADVHVRRGEFVFHENEPADHFYVLRRGLVAIEVRTPARGVVLDTLHDGDVLGWSWLVSPYRWTFDARATADTSAIAFDATCLRAKLAADPHVGYELTKRFIGLMNQRLQSARIRLLDIYGDSP